MTPRKYDQYRALFEPKIWAKVRILFAEFGEPNTNIRGSRLVREYCRTCGDPMRVSDEVPKCTYCRAAEHPGQDRRVAVQKIQVRGKKMSFGRWKHEA